jgi:hypothetical protein
MQISIEFIFEHILWPFIISEQILREVTVTIPNAAFCAYRFCMILTLNRDYFLKQR